MLALFPANVRQPWLKPGIFAGGLVPLAVMGLRITQGTLGADVVAILLNQFGYLALTFLTATLLCTPVRILAGWTWGIRLRRMLGLFAFFYASLHFLTYVVVDQSLDLSAVLDDVLKRTFILIGLLTLLILIPLAVTSTNRMVRRMGFARWKQLHRLTYAAGCLGVVHFIWRVKIDLREPLIFAGIVGAALALRLIHAMRGRSGKRPTAAAV